MEWKPVSEVEIKGQIDSALKRMTVTQRRLWDVIRIAPEKWRQNPWGNQGNGFWVVALLGNSVVWYNDIEQGFNRSTYLSYGEINEYVCNQDKLEWALQFIVDEIDGYGLMLDEDFMEPFE